MFGVLKKESQLKTSWPDWYLIWATWQMNGKKCLPSEPWSNPDIRPMLLSLCCQQIISREVVVLKFNVNLVLVLWDYLTRLYPRNVSVFASFPLVRIFIHLLSVSFLWNLHPFHCIQFYQLKPFSIHLVSNCISFHPKDANWHSKRGSDPLNSTEPLRLGTIDMKS